MILALKLRKEDELGKDYKAFLPELDREVRALDRQEIANRFMSEKRGCVIDSDSDREPDAASRRPQMLHNQASEQPLGRTAEHRRPALQYRDQARSLNRHARAPTELGKRKRELPACLNPRCRDRHFLNDCSMTSPEEKKRLKRK